MTRKMLVFIGLTLGIAAFFVANQPITPELAVVSSISVLLFAVPSYREIIRQNTGRGLILLVLLGIYALFVESIALKYGFPYGRFTYTDVLGNKIFGLTPWTVAFAYPPLLMLTYWFARQRHIDGKKILFSTAFDAMLIDLVLDPAAVALGFWYWDNPGSYYGIPLINFGGWLLSGLMGAVILHMLLHKTKVNAGIAWSGMLILVFWTMVNLWLGLWLPVIFGIALSAIFMHKLLHGQEI